MKIKTYGDKISEILINRFRAEGYKARKLSTASPFISKIEVLNSTGGRLNIKGELSKDISDLHIKVTIPSIRRERYNVVCKLDEPFANNTMLQEAADKMYKAFKNSL